MTDTYTINGMKSKILDDGRVATWRSKGNVIHLRIFDPSDFDFQ